MSDSRSSPGIRESLSPLKQAFLALEEAEQRIRQLEQNVSEPIAIVGMGCRFPGAENGPEDFWRLLHTRQCAVGDAVEARLGLSFERDHLPPQARWAALLDRVDLFDPRHFGIAPREAGAMDPQQRLLLEVTWEALENAGIDPNSLYQTQTGVYVGIASHDYAQLAVRHQRPDQIDQYFAAGSGASVASGRISYVLGLNGPALSVDTACSSSLVAVHLACEALQRGACTTALAAGVNLILSPEACAAFAQAGMLSPRGICAAFDENADGFVRGEGCGVVVLKRLRDAEAAGDRVLAVILGSAVNQDGASSGLTVPNGLAQQALMREAHRRAGIEAHQVGYIETHGTGTKLGDPIEAEALGSVFSGRASKLLMGSVKANIGHLESAAGVAGLIKLVLSLEHGEVPGQVHWRQPSSHVRWQELPLEVDPENHTWEPIEGRRIGGVSSFGFSGTNAHVVVEGRKPTAREESAETGEDVLVISARTQPALRELAERYVKFLEGDTDYSWAEICHTAGAGRAAMSDRLALVACSRGEAAEKLRAWLRGETSQGISSGHVGAGQRGVLQPDVHATPEQIASCFVQGAKVNWERRRGERRRRRAPLPRYPFQRERYWIEERKKTLEIGESTGRGMLGSRLCVAGVRAQYETQLDADSWVGEHLVEGRVILPATGHIELMLEAGAETLGGRCVIEDLVLQATLDVEGERRVHTVVDKEVAGRSRVRIYAQRGEGDWDQVSEGWLRRAEKAEAERRDLDPLRDRLQERDAGDAFYSSLRCRGLEFGDRFRGLRRLWSGEGEALGEIATATDTNGNWELAPWALDACIQVAAAIGEPEALYLPMSMERIEVFRSMPE
ncbi:MAG TPA: beta-ketoacyl synthase N-terminal-like domain-containing protein, partial [Acidobacteriaceae bacterium]|nr:beta-ketoacyl synthase N-terminal-like domain-containing protein [Acidobacteriaceae bacterium]